MKNKEILYGVAGVVATFLLMEKPKASARKKSGGGGGFGSGSTSGTGGLLTPTAVESTSTNINVNLKDKEDTDDISPTKGGGMTDSMGNAVSPIGGGDSPIKGSRPTGGNTPTPSKRPMSRPAPRPMSPRQKNYLARQQKMKARREAGRGFDGEGYDFMGRDVEDSFLMDY